MNITMTSPFTGKVNTLDLDITAQQLKRWQEGELIQNVMPDLSADEREFLMTGYMPGEWEQMFGEEEIYCDVCGLTYAAEEPCQQH